MLTPAFEICQDEGFLIFTIKAKFARVSETEIYVDGGEFKFYSKPYFLRLNLPGRMVEDGRESAEYNADSGHYIVKIAKETKGEHFEGLDMLTKLLAPKGSTSASQPLIEVISETNNKDGKKEEEEDEEENFDWQVNQEPCLIDENAVVSDVYYGFAKKRSGVFQRLQEELNQIVDVPEPDKTSHHERRLLRLKNELDTFSDDHYLADFFQDEAIQDLMEYKPCWITEQQIKFTEQENEQMLKLPKKRYLLGKDEEKMLFCGLVDILFAYAYNHRTTEGENTVESNWTICKLSSTLSWLDDFSSLSEVVKSNFRRALCFPLYRHWDLNRKLVKDVVKILKLGQTMVVKCLLEVHRLLAYHETQYILNDLYLTDYSVWAQYADQTKLSDIATQLQQLEICKSDLGLQLEELEQAARLVIKEEEQEGDQLAQELSHMGIVHQEGYPELFTRDCGLEDHLETVRIGSGDSEQDGHHLVVDLSHTVTIGGSSSSSAEDTCSEDSDDETSSSSEQDSSDDEVSSDSHNSGEEVSSNCLDRDDAVGENERHSGDEEIGSNSQVISDEKVVNSCQNCKKTVGHNEGHSESQVISDEKVVRNCQDDDDVVGDNKENNDNTGKGSNAQS